MFGDGEGKLKAMHGMAYFNLYPEWLTAQNKLQIKDYTHIHAHTHTQTSLTDFFT